MSVVDGSYNHPMELEEHATMPLAGGIEQMGYQCGQLWGAALAAGAQAYRLFGAGPQAEAAAVSTTQRLVNVFRACYKTINCLELTELSLRDSDTHKQTKQLLKFIARGGPIRCFSMAAGYARAVADEMQAAFSDDRHEVPVPPISCAALLAQKMGASALHTVMAAGLAGGIGLSGGACGALGAAIWLIEMDRAQKGSGKVEYNSPEASEAIDRFLKSTDYEFECARIAGRQFVDADDHARYVREGGCAAVLEALATGGSAAGLPDGIVDMRVSKYEGD